MADLDLVERMDKPRIFIGSSGKQAKLLQALTRGLQDVAHVDPWTTSLTPGTSTLDRLVELAHQVDFAAFVFARDDWTTANPAASPSSDTGQDSPRDNVVFEAGLFGGVLGMRRTFILHAHGSKLPTDLLGLISILTEVEAAVLSENARVGAPCGMRKAGYPVTWTPNGKLTSVWFDEGQGTIAQRTRTLGPTKA